MTVPGPNVMTPFYNDGCTCGPKGICPYHGNFSRQANNIDGYECFATIPPEELTRNQIHWAALRALLLGRVGELAQCTSAFQAGATALDIAKEYWEEHMPELDDWRPGFIQAYEQSKKAETTFALAEHGTPHQFTTFVAAMHAMHLWRQKNKEQQFTVADPMKVAKFGNASAAHAAQSKLSLVAGGIVEDTEAVELSLFDMSYTGVECPLPPSDGYEGDIQKKLNELDPKEYDLGYVHFLFGGLPSESDYKFQGLTHERALEIKAEYLGAMLGCCDHFILMAGIAPDVPRRMNNLYNLEDVLNQAIQRAGGGYKYKIVPISDPLSWNSNEARHKMMGRDDGFNVMVFISKTQGNP